MTSRDPISVDESEDEISVLIRALREADVRLDELTCGEVDTVFDRDGQSFMLRRAQEAGRSNEAAKQAAILSALPANIALLNAEGFIVSTNEAWRRFGSENGYSVSDAAIPVNYLDVCDGTRGQDAADAGHAANGIRSVLTNQLAHFSLEYGCNSPTVERWFQLTVTPLAGDPPNGAVIMHIDITQQKRSEGALRRFEAAMDGVTDAIFLIDRSSMRCVHVNDAACRMFNRTHQELLQIGPAELSAAPGEEWERTYDRLIAGDQQARNEEILMPGPDGSPTWFDVRRDVHCHENRWTIVVVARDVTARKRAEARIRQLNRLYAVLSGINTLIVRASDRSDLFANACRIAVEVGGFKMAWIGVIDSQTQEGGCIVGSGADDAYLQGIRLTARSGQPNSDLPACRALRLGQPVICNDIASDVSMEAVRPDLLERGLKSVGCFPLGPKDRPEAVLALLSDGPDIFDAEELRLLEELAGDISYAMGHIVNVDRLSYLAFYDELTGLANRRLFLERVGQFIRTAAAEGHGLAVFLVDLERFKNVNYSLGRTVGDELLRQVANWLKHDQEDAGLVARVGADHFAVVLPRITHQDGVARSLEKAMQRLQEHRFLPNGHELRVAARVGVAISPHDGADADALLKNAEAALKKTKEGGSRYLFYSTVMTESVARNLTLENQLRRALDLNEFVLHYQPKVDVLTGDMTGVEALIRWNNPRTGLIPPGQFIPILEESGLIYEVGRWAIAQAVEVYLGWCDAGLSAVRIAVNVSPVQLSHRDFIATVREIVGVDPRAARALELELTESLVMDDIERSIASLELIRAMGVSVAIDDFGTGFSSLSYLSKLPVDALKIDRSFVADMTVSPRGLALVSTIIGLAHSLKLKVVAEGVETGAQLRLLRAMKCDDFQGYLFSKPVPREILETKFLARASANAIAN